MNLNQFTAAFDTEEKCVAHLAALRWPSGPVCDKCGVVDQATKAADRPRYWHCRACRNKFSVTKGTPMEETRLPLPTWFAAIFLISTSSKGVSSLAISRQLGISYKSAWFLTHRIRAMLDGDGGELLRGVVEVDETYIGGKRRKDQKSKRDSDDDQPKGRSGSRKMMAVTAVERDGKAKARKGRTHSARTLANAVFDWADRDSILMTDELPAYRWIGKKFRAHFRVNHSADEWVRRDPLGRVAVHTNTVESFNATIKRAIIGVWHWFSIKHGDRYLDELAARWNWRGQSNMARFNGALAGMFKAPLPWKELTA
jgi:transposase-like protein